MTGATSLMHIGNKIYAAGSALIRLVFCIEICLSGQNIHFLRFLFVKNSLSTDHQYFKKDQFIIKCILVPQVFYCKIYIHENHDIPIAMSSSRADPVIGLNILQG